MSQMGTILSTSHTTEEFSLIKQKLSQEEI